MANNKHSASGLGGESKRNPELNDAEINSEIEVEILPKSDDSKPGKPKQKKGAPIKHVDLDKPIVTNFIVYLIGNDASDREIARQVNVPNTTFVRWKKRNIHLWNRAAPDPVREAEKSLMNRVKGHWVERPVYDKDGNFLRTKYQYYPPSDGAIQYFLNNRAPQDWKARVEHNHAIEELPRAINFVRASDTKKEKKERAIVDDFGNEVKLITDERDKKP
jgi:hypothetical protein